MMTELRDKRIAHVGVRFYRLGSVDVLLVPLLRETASFARGAGEGYFLVALLGEPGTAYPLDLRSPASFDPEYLAAKFRLDRRGYGFTPEELAATLRHIADDLEREERLDG
ncbi:MAG: hypothetical protein RMK15_04590 [Chloroflexota bacterium]|nr:hypothetical protein [Dehalococcoidia bacterium]MDW8046539.1 hypothetical protein [Chloroflexota bacterium]